MLPQHALQGLVDTAHLRPILRPIGTDWRIPTRQQQRIPLPQRNIQCRRNINQHLLARRTAPDLDETDVPLRHPASKFPAQPGQRRLIR